MRSRFGETVFVRQCRHDYVHCCTRYLGTFAFYDEPAMKCGTHLFMYFPEILIDPPRELIGFLSLLDVRINDSLPAVVLSNAGCA